MSDINSPERKGISDPGELRPRETRQADPRLAKALGDLSIRKAQRQERMDRAIPKLGEVGLGGKGIER